MQLFGCQLRVFTLLILLNKISRIQCSKVRFFEFVNQFIQIAKQLNLNSNSDLGYQSVPMKILNPAVMFLSDSNTLIENTAQSNRFFFLNPPPTSGLSTFCTVSDKQQCHCYVLFPDYFMYCQLTSLLFFELLS